MGFPLPEGLETLEGILQHPGLFDAGLNIGDWPRMRLKKESMRQIADAGMVARAQRSIDDAAADPIGFAQRQRSDNLAERQYIRGALVKPKRTDNRS
jgi:hypothetical protein